MERSAIRDKLGEVHYRRSLVPGGTFFFTVTLREAFRITRSERPFTIDAIVILPDHLHRVMTLPTEDADFSGRWRRIKSSFTRQVVTRGLWVARDNRGEYMLWQRRFWEHAIRDQRDLDRHVGYIHFNPVKHGLVTRVVD